MTQIRPTPILRDNPSRLQRLLLTSAQIDVPPRRGKNRTLLALGFGGTLVATTQAASAVTGATSAVTSAIVSTAASFGLGVAVLKGVAIGLVTGSMTYGSVMAVRGHALRVTEHNQLEATRTFVTSRPTTRSLHDPPPMFTANPAAAPAVLDPSVPSEAHSDGDSAIVPSPNEITHSEGTREEAASVPVAIRSLGAQFSSTVPAARTSNIAAAPTSAGSVFAASVESAPPPRLEPHALATDQKSLASEVSILEQAQREINLGQAQAAMATLNEYNRNFQRPRLLPEAIFIQIQTLLALGRAQEARKLGKQLVSAQPGGTLARRVRSLLNVSIEDRSLPHR